jgi:cytochrome c peroxidase
MFICHKTKHKTHTSMKKIFVFTAFASLLFGFQACNKVVDIVQSTPKLPEVPYEYLSINRFGSTQNLSQLIKDESAKTINNHSVALGRVLFYDKNLSINNHISCGSCHIQQLAFSDGVALSNGFRNKKTTRNSMGLLNAVLNNNMFWDSRAGSPLELSLMPVFDHLEMGMESHEMLVNKLEKVDYYPALFEKAFGTKDISSDKIALALTHFIHSIFSENSKFDQRMKNPAMKFTELEQLGSDLFFSPRLKCGECHNGPNFSAPDFPGGPYGARFDGNTSQDRKGTANIGLDRVYADKGRKNGHFKIPSLRNIELTAPYMHDGRFATLEQVIDHYDRGIQAHPELDDKLKENGKPIRMHMNEIEKKALLAFLKTLTDKELIRDPRFSDPFVH